MSVIGPVERQEMEDLSEQIFIDFKNYCDAENPQSKAFFAKKINYDLKELYEKYLSKMTPIQGKDFLLTKTDDLRSFFQEEFIVEDIRNLYTSFFQPSSTPIKTEESSEIKNSLESEQFSESEESSEIENSPEIEKFSKVEHSLESEQFSESEESSEIENSSEIEEFSKFENPLESEQFSKDEELANPLVTFLDNLLKKKLPYHEETINILRRTKNPTTQEKIVTGLENLENLENGRRNKVIQFLTMLENKNLPRTDIHRVGTMRTYLHCYHLLSDQSQDEFITSIFKKFDINFPKEQNIGIQENMDNSSSSLSLDI